MKWCRSLFDLSEGYYEQKEIRRLSIFLRIMHIYTAPQLMSFLVGAQYSSLQEGLMLL